LLCVAGVASAADIDVITQNQYLGTDLTPVIVSPPAEINARVVQALENIAASLPTERLSRLAKLIADRSPHVVVLNEAFLYSCENVDENTPEHEGWDNQRIKGAFVDFLKTTENNLVGKYSTVARVGNFQVAGLEFEIDHYRARLTVKDRDAIMVRSDVAGAASAVPIWLSPCRKSLEGCNYFPEPFTVPTALGELPIERGFLAVDLTVSGQRYRVFGTHLEVRQLVPGPLGEPTRALQRAQAAQLVQTALLFPALPGTRKLIAGDINSAAADGTGTIATPIGPLPPPYALIAGYGFADAWTLRPGTEKAQGAPLTGFSCCQAEDLSNHNSMLNERIDIIFSLPAPNRVLDARLLGETAASKTWPPGLGLWPSDHASVAAKLQY
jgi:hypothetical protein